MLDTMQPEPAGSYLEKGGRLLWPSKGHGRPLSASSGAAGGLRSYAPHGHSTRRLLRLGVIAVAAILHLAVLASLLSHYYTPHTLISMQLKEEEEVLLEAPSRRRLPEQQQQQDQEGEPEQLAWQQEDPLWQQGEPQQGQQSRAGGSAGASSLLLAAIAELKGAPEVDPRFAAMGEGEILGRLDAALQLEDFNPPEEMGLDKNAFCKLVALKSSARHANATGGSILFEAPRVRVDAPGVVLTTYFNSRVDPLRCYKHKGGRIESDALEYMEHWYTSVVRLGLPAVVFHESLSPEFVERVQTDLVRFQRVQLAHHSWSLCDERWAVYLDWLQNSGSTVRYVLQVDVSDTVLARDPFQLFQAQSGRFDLWVNVQKNTQWVQDNFKDCYGLPQPYLLGEQGLVYNAGVVGGKRSAFEDLATAILAQFRPMLGERDGRPVWNCDMAALHYVLTHPSFQAGHRIFNGGFPFCAGGIKCWKHGECKYYVYHK